MSLETKYLKKIINERTFVDIYNDNYEESCYGYILDFNDTFLVLDSYNDESIADGIIVFFRGNITRIRWGGNEISSASKLIDNSKRTNIKSEIDLSSVQNVIKSINENYGYINISIQDIDSSVCFIGEICEMDEETVVIDEFGTKTSLDRKNIMLSINDITKIEAGGIYEENLKKLFKK